MKIGNIELGEKPVFLAPMEDVTDIGFRMLCKRFGAAMVYTEFVSAEALVRDVKSTIRKLTIADEERPVGIQIYGRDVEAMVEAAKIVEQAGPDVIDLNFGCPVKKVAGKGAGAGMLQNIPKMLEITRQVVNAVKLPVTAKTRLGWNAEQLIITELAEQLQDCGIQALTIHGRTRAQMYTGNADWTLIGEVKRNPRIHIPIIGNGDIKSLDDADHAFEEYGVDAVMIGRATFGCPWIFSRRELTLDEKIDVLEEQLRINVERIDEYRGPVAILPPHLSSRVFLTSARPVSPCSVRRRWRTCSAFWKSSEEFRVDSSELKPETKKPCGSSDSQDFIYSLNFSNRSKLSSRLISSSLK